jgi:hypothetical protein
MPAHYRLGRDDFQVQGFRQEARLSACCPLELVARNIEETEMPTCDVKPLLRLGEIVKCTTGDDRERSRHLVLGCHNEEGGAGHLF